MATDIFDRFLEYNDLNGFAVNETNEKFSRVEQIKKFTLVGEEWMPDSDMLTPTSKLKRRGIHARYAAEIEALYWARQFSRSFNNPKALW